MSAGSEGEARLYLEVKSYHTPEDTLRGEALCLQGVWARLYIQISSHHTPKDTLRGEALCLQGVWERLYTEVTSHHTPGDTLRRSPMFAGGLSESLALSCISIAIGSLWYLTLPKIVISTEVTG